MLQKLIVYDAEIGANGYSISPNFNLTRNLYVNKGMFNFVEEKTMNKKKYFRVELSNGDILFTKPFKV